MNNRKNSQSDRLAELAAELEITPGLVFGLDIGIASCGWAVVNVDTKHIHAIGSRCFDAPEDPKTKTLHNVERRTKRGMRRVTYRRKVRMKAVRRLLRESGLWDNPSPDYFQSLASDAPDPWQARADGVTGPLEPEDTAAALIHLAKHRGFKSNAKRDTSDGEGGKVLKAAREWDKKLGERTYAQTLVDDHPDRKRNRSGDYRFMPRRERLVDEARKIISRQRGLGAEWATREFEDEYLKTAFDQLPLRSSESLVGECPFEPNERRAARFSYSFEKFRLLEKLVHGCRVTTKDGERSLTINELEIATRNFGHSTGLTFKQLRTRLNLSDDEKITAALTEDDLKRDVTKSASKAAPGSYALRNMIGSTEFNRLVKTPDVLDHIADIITFNEDDSDIRSGFNRLDLSPETVQALMNGLSQGKFSKFKGTGHISAKAARKLIPEMLKGKRYDEACAAVGYDHAAARGLRVEDIKNPVVQRSLNQAIKQIEVLVREFGRPERIHVEMLRDVGKSAKVRNEIETKNKSRRKERERLKNELGELTDNADPNRDDVEKYELMKEQGCRCPYCDRHLNPDMISSSDVQVDHIYPRSLSHEDSYVNKVLTCVPCNQQKRNRTPWEWRGESNPDWWREFEARLSSFNFAKRDKKRRLLNQSFAERSPDFIERNKVDSSYVARALSGKLQDLYPESYAEGAIIPGAETRIRARPGQMTPKLQRAWFGDRYKKDREDDRHHAMDALTVAFLDEALYQTIARVYQRWEETGQQQHYVPDIDPPWESFAQDCLDAYNGDWLVCRTERRRVRGALHEETIRRRTVDEDGIEVYWQRKSVSDLKKSDVANIPDPVVRDTVAAWLETEQEGKPSLPNGAHVSKVRVRTRVATSRQINKNDMGGRRATKQGGFVKNENMVRVDVYHVKHKRYEDDGLEIAPGYYVVPIYSADVAGGFKKLPTTPIARNKDEELRPRSMRREDFVFSLHKDSFVKLSYDGSNKEGYYRGADIDGGRITVSYPNIRGRKVSEQQRFSSSRIQPDSFRKFQVDRLGKLHEIKREPWPGSKHE